MNRDVQTACNQPEIGSRLHEYELATLDSKTAEQFEDHLIQCEFCCHQLEQTMAAMQELGELRTEVLAELRDHGLALEWGVRPDSPAAMPGKIRKFFRSSQYRFVIPAVAVAAIAVLFLLRKPVEQVAQLNLVRPRMEDAAPSSGDDATERIVAESTAVPPAQQQASEPQLRREAAAGKIVAESTAVPQAQKQASEPQRKRMDKASETPAATQMEAVTEPEVRDMQSPTATAMKIAEPPPAARFRELATRTPIASPLPIGMPKSSLAEESALIRLGTESYEQKIYPVAADYFVQALEEEPGNASYALMGGVSYYMSRSYIKAVELLTRADSLSTIVQARAEARWFLANARLGLSDLKGADSLLKLLAGSESSYADSARSLLERIATVDSNSR